MVGAVVVHEVFVAGFADGVVVLRPHYRIPTKRRKLTIRHNIMPSKLTSASRSLPTTPLNKHARIGILATNRPVIPHFLGHYGGALFAGSFEDGGFFCRVVRSLIIKRYRFHLNLVLEAQRVIQLRTTDRPLA